MVETLRNRVSQIVVGGAHALLDKIEDQAPEAMMEQAIRKVDGVIDEVRAELGKAAANRHLAQRQHADLNRRHLELTTQAEEAVQLQREDLARAAVVKQLDVEAQIPVIEAALTDLNNQEKELSGYVDALLGKRRDMMDALEQFVASRMQASSATGLSAGTNNAQAKIDKADAAFGRIFQRQTGLTMAGQKVSVEQEAKLKELAGLVQDKRIEARLAEIKATQK